MDTSVLTQSETIKIFRCRVGFKYTKFYIEVVLMAKNKNEAKIQFISKCLEKYDEIIQIDFTRFYYEYDEETPLNFNKNNIKDFEKYLNDIMESDIDEHIECLNECSFEIIDMYD